MRKPKIAILISREQAQKIISKEDFRRLETFSDLNPEIPRELDEKAARRIIKGAEGCIVGWGEIRKLTKEILDEAPELRIIAYAGGTVKGVSDEVWRRKIVVTSAASANGIVVAEFTLGLMLTTMKRVWWFNELIHRGLWRESTEMKKIREPYGATVGVIAAGHAGRNFIRLLRNLEVEILLYDPYCSQEEAKRLGAEKVSLEELMSKSDVVSLHAPNIPSTHKMIDRKKLKLLKDGAIFISTAPAAIVDEEALIEELKTGRITACLDVPGPTAGPLAKDDTLVKDSPLRELPNVILTPHIAGALADARFRVGNYAVTEIIRFFSGREVIYRVTKDMLDRIA